MVQKLSPAEQKMDDELEAFIAGRKRKKFLKNAGITLAAGGALIGGTLSFSRSPAYDKILQDRQDLTSEIYDINQTPSAKYQQELLDASRITEAQFNSKMQNLADRDPRYRELQEKLEKDTARIPYAGSMLLGNYKVADPAVMKKDLQQFGSYREKIALASSEPKERQ